jgi:diketogulonate reductase-like aldo/keto reductase
LVEVAAEVKRPPGQVALRFLLPLSPFVKVIRKSVTPERIEQNFDVDFTLSPTQVEKLRARNRAWRITNGWDFSGCDLFSLGLSQLPRRLLP